MEELIPIQAIQENQPIKPIDPKIILKSIQTGKSKGKKKSDGKKGKGSDRPMEQNDPISLDDKAIEYHLIQATPAVTITFVGSREELARLMNVLDDFRALLKSERL